MVVVQSEEEFQRSSLFHLDHQLDHQQSAIEMAKVSQPELKRYLDKKVAVNIQGGRKIQGVLRGFDIFLNLVVDEAVEQVHPSEGNTLNWVEGEKCGTVVSTNDSFQRGRRQEMESGSSSKKKL